MSWADAMKYYGSDKPDLRFGMKFVELMDIMKGHGFSVFDNAAYVGGICAEGAATYTRKQLDALTEFVKKPQIGAKGMVYARVEVKSVCQTTVRRCTVLKRIHQEAKLCLCFFRCKAQNLEHLSLQLCIVDTDRTAANSN